MVQKKTILIIDDHPMFREGLKAIIESSVAGFEVVSEAGTAREGLRMAKKLNPDLILTDINLPDRNGIRLTHEIREFLPDAQVMIVSMHSNIDYIVRAFQAGVSGFMIKESASENLLRGLDSVSKGEYFFDSSIFPQLVDFLMRSNQKEVKIVDEAYNTLSKREQKIMGMLTEGLSIKVISEKLFISPKTVKNHRARIMSKLDIHSAHELMRYAAKIGLIDVELWKT